MKLKQAPEDFRVEELTDVTAGAAGAFAFYCLEKSGWTTPDALDLIRRRWRTHTRAMSYGGLKDRHANTNQFFTVFHGPRKNLQFKGITVRYLGQVEQPFTSSLIEGNRFQITLRGINPKDLPDVEATLKEVQAAGVPNYFDDQRFGSVGPGGRLPGHEMVLGRWEQALKLALASPYSHDRPGDKQVKSVLRECWGDWTRCKDQLPKSHARSLVSYLVDHPTDFRGAVARLRPELQGLYLSAYQGHVWNRTVARFLKASCRAEDLAMLPLRLGPLPFPRNLPPALLMELSAAQLSLPSARLKLDVTDPWLPVLNEVLAEDGLTLEEMKLKGLRKPFFSRGERLVLCLPRGMTWEFADDERTPDKKKLTLCFTLSKGAYATLIVKRLQSVQSR